MEGVLTLFALKLQHIKDCITLLCMSSPHLPIDSAPADEGANVQQVSRTNEEAPDSDSEIAAETTRCFVLSFSLLSHRVSS